ncbi:MAG: hypothetical protein J6K58_14135 [Lachnospiraceae bacterium]|nr:hypothetical protein [Lachnospiraceae bacterium]
MNSIFEFVESNILFIMFLANETLAFLFSLLYLSVMDDLNKKIMKERRN